MNITVIDIGSPEHNNIGWAVVGNRRRPEDEGKSLKTRSEQRELRDREVG